MAEADLQTLRGFELRLLRCSMLLAPVRNNDSLYPTVDRKGNPLYRLIEEVIILIESRDYIGALSSDAVRLVFGFADSWDFEDSIDSAERFYQEVEKSIQSFLADVTEDDLNQSCRAVLLMCIGVAALLAFTQTNVTGPVEEFPSFPVLTPRFKQDHSTSRRVQWDIWARNQLMSVGSDLLGKISVIQYIVYAKMLLMKTKDFYLEGKDIAKCGVKTISWWLARTIYTEQRILEERSSSLYDLLQVMMGETLHYFGDVRKVTSYWGTELQEGEASTIVSLCYLEGGIIEYTYGRVDSCRLHFTSAEEACGLELSVTGVLGFRTMHQVGAKAQMVLVTNTRTPKDGDIDVSSKIRPELLKSVSSFSDECKSSVNSRERHESSDVFITPLLLENEEDKSNSNGIHIGGSGTFSVSLEPIQQAVVLAQCLLIEKSTRDDEMQGWQMAPFIEAIDAQEYSYSIIRFLCDILRIRWESKRSRTKERALAMMDELVKGLYQQPSTGALALQRIQFSFGVYVPTIAALRKEYSELLVSHGFIGEAIKIFEDLEMWDNLIYCYCLLEKKAAAVELIKARLSETPDVPRLWCSLGDVTVNDACYEKALEVSNGRFARAKRSLARSAYNRGDYETSKILWESAMSMNSLYPDGWFALGAAALKARDIDKALDGFTRAVQLEPENGEAWNNIGCLHMIKKKSKEAFIAFKEALKFRRNSWQLWENYSQVAMDIGNFGQALEATKMVVDMTRNKRTDFTLLEKIMEEIEARSSRCDQLGTERSHETEHLTELLGKVIQQIVRTGGRDEFWGLYARWYKIKGDLTLCSEALLKHVRSYQGADLWNNIDRFKKFADASLQLCKVYMEISSSTKSRRELVTAEMHLRNTVKQGVNFSNTTEFTDLEALLIEVRKQLEAF
ncbi:tetratricopeptide repeat protein 27 homolog [Macadamia integrifolia]|uniref:tetratricopeptide repeat protein 27 homolog n=1 Tax=Macadamia integrifolia TaxID=60698 RepID=UPI001C4EF421|nr:tetratricopeptide repeat protein 27 homolog [Macadamia integrifolia]